MKKLFLILGLLLLIGSANAWTITDSQYNGSVIFLSDGTGYVQAQGYPTTYFTWDSLGGYNFEAHYLMWTVPFEYNPENDTITSNEYQGILVR